MGPDQLPVFTCPVCLRTSDNREDIRQGYCGNCHAWTGRGPSFPSDPFDPRIMRS